MKRTIQMPSRTFSTTIRTLRTPGDSGIEVLEFLSIPGM